jgi:hypothetical protein
MYTHTHTHTHTKDDQIKTHVEHVCNSGTILWNSGKKGKEKKITEHQQYQKT